MLRVQTLAVVSLLMLGALFQASSASGLSFSDVYTVNPAGTHLPWATIRSAPSSFAIGHAADGWEFDTTYRDSPRRWYYGQLSGGGFSKCAWIESANLDNDAVTTPAGCASTATTFLPSTFSSFVNCDGTVVPHCTDGTLMTTVASSGCTDTNLYANVLPWRSMTSAQDPSGTFTPGITQVYWRYRTKDDHWIMGRIKGRPAEQGEWMFIQRGCLPYASGFPSSTWDTPQ